MESLLLIFAETRLEAPKRPRPRLFAQREIRHRNNAGMYRNGGQASRQSAEKPREKPRFPPAQNCGYSSRLPVKAST
jgi:hypothetical protein